MPVCERMGPHRNRSPMKIRSPGGLPTGASGLAGMQTSSEILRREPAARKLIPFRAMSDLGCSVGAARRFIRATGSTLHKPGHCPVPSCRTGLVGRPRRIKSAGAGHEITGPPMAGAGWPTKRLVPRRFQWVTGDETSFFRCDREISEDVRPRPRVAGSFQRSSSPAPILWLLAVRGTTFWHMAWLKTRRTILPLPGERAGVRASVNSNSTENAEKP